jgi:WD40 repeat protein
MQFDIQPARLFWMRFGLFNVPGLHPILAMGNNRAEVFFWDLQKLERTFDGISSTGVPPDGVIKATRFIKGKRQDDCIRSIAWSPGGDWCIVGGDNGLLLLCSRWEGQTAPLETKK